MLVQAGAAKNGVRPWVCSWPRVVQQQAQTLQLAARRRSCRSVSSSSALYRFKCWGIVRPKLLEGVSSFDDFFLWRSLASTPTGAKKLLVEKNPDGEVEACMPSCCYAKNVMEIVNAKVSFFLFLVKPVFQFNETLIRGTTGAVWICCETIRRSMQFTPGGNVTNADLLWVVKWWKKYRARNLRLKKLRIFFSFFCDTTISHVGLNKGIIRIN